MVYFSVVIDTPPIINFVTPIQAYINSHQKLTIPLTSAYDIDTGQAIIDYKIYNYPATIPEVFNPPSNIDFVQGPNYFNLYYTATGTYQYIM